jgi:putative transposase
MKKYSNLIRDIQVCRPEQIWVSDITYIRLVNDFAYLSLITDAYSKKIVGFCLQKDLSSQGCISALNMAIRSRIYQSKDLIHHSDRGSQYCCKEYVGILADNNIAISMTENGDPYENAIAERVNGILKVEFNLYNSPKGIEETHQYLKKCIDNYNTLRPHASCNFLTPDQAHFEQGPLKRKWKN